MSRLSAGRDIGPHPVIRTLTIASTRRLVSAAHTPSTTAVHPFEEVSHRGS